jgi:hypothetical protein
MAEEKVRPRRIKYHSSTQRGAGASSRDDSDNPLSQNFLPPDERGERGKARWWALHGKKYARVGAVEFDG